MGKIGKRLLTFFIGIPVVLLLVFCDVLNHFPLHVAFAVFSALAANEFYTMLSENNVPVYKRAFIVAGACLLPYSGFIFTLFHLSLELVFWLFIFEVLVFMTYEVFYIKNFSKSVIKISVSAFVILYTGFFVTFISRMTILPNSTFILANFFISVFMCDSGAWFFGVLFGKNNKGIIAASPNKSIAGFIGGILTSIFFGSLFKFIFSEIFTLPLLNLAIISGVTAIAAIVGDLFESVIKRCLNFKDSGKIIPGRGGVMDSIDSILIAAPVYYILVHFLF